MDTLRIKYFFVIILLVFLFSACSTGNSLKKYTSNKNTKVYFEDLCDGGAKEIIVMEDRFTASGQTIFLILDAKKEIVASFSVPGNFARVEFPELNWDEHKEIAVYYEDKDKYSNLVVYRFKDNKLTKLFTVDKARGIDTDFSTALIAKVTVDRSNRIEDKGYTPSVLNNTERWVWTGDKFIRE